MIKSDLIQIFKKLTKPDRRALRQFVRSPYFNRRAEVISLYDYIDKQLDSAEPNWEKESVFKTIFPSEPTYLAAQMDYAMSFLLQVIRSYLVQDELEKEVIENRLRLHKALDSRGLHKFAQRELEATKSALQQTHFRNAGFHRLEYDILLAEYTVLSRGKRSNTLPLQPLSDALDAYYLAETLRLAIEMQSHVRVVDYSYKQPLLNAVLSHYEGYQLLPAVAAYYQVYHCFGDIPTEVAEANFRQLKRILEEQAGLFPHVELRSLYLAAINYCIRRVNNYHSEYHAEILSLYKTGLKNGALMENGILSPFSYRNIATIAMKMGHFEWTAQFLEAYRMLLPEKNRKNWYDFYRAVLHYRQGEFAISLDLLRPLKFDEASFNLDARCMMMQIYYQISEINLLDFLLESTKMYLLRHDDVGYVKENYENFIKYLKKILQLKPNDLAERAKLKAEIELVSYIYDKDFFKTVLAPKEIKK
ncbi:MAG: hypothetical protein RLZZ628_1041 [Bacteroidota bacterium]|jgi:hypothetical protein